MNYKNLSIIVGVEGQDGRLMYDFLNKKNYSIIGIGKKNIVSNIAGYKNKIDITNRKSVVSLIKKFKPKYIYYLAAFHQSSQDSAISNIELMDNSYQINVFSYVNFLEAVKNFSPDTKVFYAGSSMIFESAGGRTVTEKTDYSPNSIYGITKLDALLIGKYYRENFGLKVSTGILFNHESEFRSSNFISKRIVETVIKIRHKKVGQLIVGDLSAEADWGYAPDFIEAMYLIICTKHDDFVVATGRSHSVKDFVKIAFGYFGLDWKKYVVEDRRLVKRKRSRLVGNITKIRREIGWKPKHDFKEMIYKIIEKLDK